MFAPRDVPADPTGNYRVTLPDTEKVIWLDVFEVSCPDGFHTLCDGRLDGVFSDIDLAVSVAKRLASLGLLFEECVYVLFAGESEALSVTYSEGDEVWKLETKPRSEVKLLHEYKIVLHVSALK